MTNCVLPELSDYHAEKTDMFRKAWLFCVALCAVASGCEGALPVDCTNIGCENGLIVNIQGAPQGPVTVEASAPGLQTQTQVCPAGLPCASVMFLDFTPPTATITVTIGDRTSTSQVTLAPRHVQPNGPGCLPGCNQPLVTVAPPAP